MSVDPAIHSFLANTDNSISITPDQQREWEAALITALINGIQILSWLQFFWMTQSNNWLEYGKDAIITGFHTHLSEQYPHHPNKNPTDHAQDTLDHWRLTHEISVDPTDSQALKLHIDQFAFCLWGEQFTGNDIPKINALLTRLESQYRLHGGYHGQHQEYILGFATIQEIGPYTIVKITDEIARTPTIIMAMAAVIHDHEIIVRMDSLHFLFTVKWLPVPTLPPPPAPKDWLGWAIKRQAWRSRRLQNSDNLSDYKTQFIDDMGKIVLHHELGHGIIHHQQLDPLSVAIGQASQWLGTTILVTLLEVLAEIAPIDHEDPVNSGPFAMMAQISQSDSRHASQMAWIYLSDIYFFDTPDWAMYPYSAIILMLIFPHIQPTRQFDFNGIQSIWTTKNGPLAQLLVRYTTLVNDLLTLLPGDPSCEEATDPTYWTDIFSRMTSAEIDHIKSHLQSAETDILTQLTQDYIGTSLSTPAEICNWIVKGLTPLLR